MQATAPFALFHIPHASTDVPADIRSTILLSDVELHAELLRMTDWFTDELFQLPDNRLSRVVFPFSRLVTDPERFPDDRLEVMARRGMGAIYTQTSSGRPLRSTLAEATCQEWLERFYWPHHRQLTAMANEALSAHGAALIIDCHSFPSHPLPCDLDQTGDRPDICLGTDTFHTPSWLVQAARDAFEAEGLSVGIDRPYAGTIVPSGHYAKNERVSSLMVEVNRRLYMDESSGERSPEYPPTRRILNRVLGLVVDGAAAALGLSDNLPPHGEA